MDFEQVLAAAAKLTTLEQVRLVERLIQALEAHVKQNTPQAQESKQVLYSAWQTLDISAEDVDEIRRSAYEGFGTPSHLDVTVEEEDLRTSGTASDGPQA